MSNVSGAKKIGRPAVNATPVNCRVPPDLLAKLDAWIEAQPEPKPTRPAAMLRFAAERLG